MELMNEMEDDNEKLRYLLFRLRRSLYKISEKKLTPYKITPEQAGMLQAIHLKSNCATFPDLTRLQFRELHTVSGLISRMQKRGWVKVSKAEDGKKRIAMTEDGKKIWEKTRDVHECQEIFNELSDEERQYLISKLSMLFSKSLDKLRTYYSSPF